MRLIHKNQISTDDIKLAQLAREMFFCVTLHRTSLNFFDGTLSIFAEQCN